MSEKRFKIAAYGICRRDETILLARYVDRQSGERWWTLPGGKLEHGENPTKAVRREVSEETGYTADVTQLLGTDSRTSRVDWGIPGGADLHAVGIYYEMEIVGGKLSAEVGGSTDDVRWVPTPELPNLDRAVIVDIGLDLFTRRPADGNPRPIPVTGRLRH